MDENDYNKNVVTRHHYWHFGNCINKIELNILNESYKNWDMKEINVTSCYKMYNVGYNLGPYDNLKFIKSNRSLRCNWVNDEWLPLWGNLTNKKANLTKSIKKYWLHERLILLNLILNTYYIPKDIINLIFNYSKDI